MRKFLSALLILAFTSPLSTLAADFDSGGYDFDYKFLDNPFAGQRMVSDKEFNEVVAQRTQQVQKSKRGFWYWILGGHKRDKEEASRPPAPDFNAPSEISSLKEAVNKKPVVILGPEIVDSQGRVLTPGYYQISIKEQHMELSQGSQVLGKLKIRTVEDDWDTNSLIYARIVNIGEDFVKIIYSNLDYTYEGIARVKK